MLRRFEIFGQISGAHSRILNERRGSMLVAFAKSSIFAAQS
jgi:hypothetical protein